jgi:hypothetical protein
MKSDEVKRKLRVENLERCMNCRQFTHCPLIKDEIVCCAKYQEVDEKEQVVVINLKHYCGMVEAYGHR